MTDTPNIGGESAKFLSDGLTLQLQNGDSVSPQLRTPGSNEPWVATWVNPDTGEVGVGPEVDDVRAILYLSPAKAQFDPETGDRIWHYEWNGWLYCDRVGKPFEWETGEVTCPHCSETITVSEPKPVE